MADPGLGLPEADWERALPEALPARSELQACLQREEFALAYTPLGDMGQLLRHPTPDGFEAGFVAGYREAGGSLPEGWRTTARLPDLANLLGFLDGELERPNVGRTRIEETVRADP
ncbi:MAG: hypothetical protein R3F62_06735 [Planctomycetota bacterium]